MAIPTNRQEFTDYCLRKLGAPVIEINVDPDQVQDRIDEALLFYWDYHFSGSEKTYYKHIITLDDIKNSSIKLPDNIIGAVSIFDISDALNSNNIFNIKYQIALNDLYSLTSVSLVPYYMAVSHIQFIEQILVGKQSIRYNRNINTLHVDMDWTQFNPGDFLIVEAYQVVDPEVYPKTWADRWLARYAECLIKLQWGQNLKKFSGMTLPGGLKFNGQQIYDEAEKERAEIERKVISDFSTIVLDRIG